MADEYPSAKKEPLWLSILPPMPRISVSTNSRARFAHRRPILLSTATPLPQAVVSSTPSPFSSKSPKNSEESPILETPPPMPSSASSSPFAAAEVPLPAFSSPSLDRVETAAPAAALNPDAVCKPVNLCLVGNNDSSGNFSSPSTAPDFVAPNPDECTSINGSYSSVSCTIFKTLSAPALQRGSSCEDDRKDMQKNTAGLTLRSVGGVYEGKQADSGKKSGDGCTSSYTEFTLSRTSFSASCLNTLEELDESRGTDIRGNPENCSGIDHETDVSYIVKDEKLVLDERQLTGNGVKEVKDPDSGEPGKDGCTSSVMEFTVSGKTPSAKCLETLEDVYESTGADFRVKNENREISNLVKDEELFVEEVEIEEGQLPSDGDAGSGEPGKHGCPPSGMEFTVAETTSSTRCLNLPEGAEVFKGAGISVNLESCSENGREPEFLDSVKSIEFVLDEGELEEGQLPGEWSGGEESQEDSEAAQTLEESADVSSAVRGVPIIPETGNVADQMYYPFQVEEIPSEQRSRGTSKAKGKKKKKHKKGEGSKKRSREKSKEKFNEVLKKRRAEGKRVDDGSHPPGLRNSKDCSSPGEQTRNGNGTSKFKKMPEVLPQTATPNKPTVDEGPEDGEILLEATKTNNGILSSLVEAEVGLWTTDNVDDQFVTEMEQDGAVKKKRGPETAERKLKRKIAKRKKRAQKERKLGIRRPPRATQSKPVKVLCTHYMKGRCAKGDQCTYSHDAVPLTKLEPCKFLMSHSCLKGDDCPYSHDLRAFPCKFFHTRGLCYDGANCKFSHGAISEEALEKLKQRVEKEKKDRISSTSAFDIPTPSFSISLPPELDPDPLGWGTSSTYNHEEPTQDTNPTILEQSTDFYGDFNPENPFSVSPAVGMMSGQSIGTKDTKFDAVSAPQIIEKAKECKYMYASNTEAMESGKSGGLKREAEFPVPMDLQSKGAPYNSTTPRTLKTPVCPSPPNERSNARDVLEVSRMEGKIDDSEQSLLEEHSTNSNESGSLCVLSVHSCMVSPSATKLAVPLLRGRQLGSLVVDHEKNPLSPSLAESKSKHTVESLLGEALRQ